MSGLGCAGWRGCGTFIIQHSAFSTPEELPRGGDRQRRDFVDRPAGDAHRAGLGPQPAAAALLAHHLAAERLEPLPLRLAERRGVFLFQHPQHAGEPLARAVQQLLAEFRRELLQRRVPADAGLRRGTGARWFWCFRNAAGVSPFQGAIAPAASERLASGRTSSGSNATRRPKPLARRTRPVGTVEAERPRLQLLVADLAVGAGVLRAEEPVVPDAARRPSSPRARPAPGRRRAGPPG